VCHKIGRHLATGCDVLKGFVHLALSATYRRACELWIAPLPVLNRPVLFGTEERFTVRRQEIVLWTSFVRASSGRVSRPSSTCLHVTLLNWLQQYGSLALCSGPGIETWHWYSAFSLQETADSAQYEKKWPTRTGMEDSRPIFPCTRFSCNENALYFNQNATDVSAAPDSKSCVRLVERAPVSRGPGNLAFNRGKRRATAAVDARCAKKLNDLRTARDQIGYCRGARQSTACAATSLANAENWASNVYQAAVGMITTYRAGAALANKAAVAISAAEAAVAAETQALLERAEEACMKALLQEWIYSMYRFLCCCMKRGASI